MASKWCSLKNASLVCGYLQIVTFTATFIYLAKLHFTSVLELFSNGSPFLGSITFRMLLICCIANLIILLFPIYLIYGITKEKPGFLLAYLIFGIIALSVTGTIHTVFVLLAIIHDSGGLYNLGYIAAYVLYPFILLIVFKTYQKLCKDVPRKGDSTMEPQIMNRLKNLAKYSKLELFCLVYGLLNIVIPFVLFIVGVANLTKEANVTEMLMYNNVRLDNENKTFNEVVNGLLPLLLILFSIHSVCFSAYFVYGAFLRRVHPQWVYFVYGVSMLALLIPIFLLWLPLAIYFKGKDYVFISLILIIIDFCGVFIVRYSYKKLESQQSAVLPTYKIPPPSAPMLVEDEYDDTKSKLPTIN